MPKVIQVRNFHAINDEEWRVLTAIETGMRNHEYVPLNMIHNYASVDHSGKNFVKILRSSLVPHRLIAYETNGYRLTNLGYDFLALRKFIKSQIVYDLSNFQLFATGKESDLYVCKPTENCHEEFGIDINCPIVLKFHRLGRTSFKQVKNKREYKTGNNCSWIYMNRISAGREYSTMKELYDAKLPVPTPLGHNRGAVAMEYVNSAPLFKFSKFVLENGAAQVLYQQAKGLLVKLAELGLVHGDFNEFNLLVEVKGYDALKNMSNDDEIDEDDESYVDNSETSDEEDLSEEESTDEESESGDCSDYNENLDCPYLDQDVNSFKLRMIDFPQVISRNNAIAQEIYARDRHGVVSFFSKFTKIDEADLPPADIDAIERTDFLDVKLKAPGFPKNHNIQDGEKLLDEEVEQYEKGITLESSKKRLAKEKSKQGKRQNIHKQQRNIKKKEHRMDMQADIFQ